MTQSIFSPDGRFPRLRVRHIAPIEKRSRSIGAARSNPDLHDRKESKNMLDQMMTALRNRNVRRRWQRDLLALDDRLLRDIGVARADAERAARRPGFWI